MGTVAILFVLLGYKSDKLWSYYYVGIGATILNLWQQLKSVWDKIPFWAYLLFAGLVLVGFVTYQEYAGQKKTEEEKTYQYDIKVDNVSLPIKKGST